MSINVKKQIFYLFLLQKQNECDIIKSFSLYTKNLHIMFAEKEK